MRKGWAAHAAMALGIAIGLLVTSGSAGVAEEGATPAASNSGIRLEVASWVPARDKNYGWWGVTRAGEAPSKPLQKTEDSDTILLPPGVYDVHWVQDYDTSGKPLLLASGVKVEPGQVATVSANSGIRLEVASWVPARDKNYGWWGVTRAGEAPDKRLHWTKMADNLLLPPGSYDVYWVQDYDTSGKPLLLAGGVQVEPGRLEKISANSGIKLKVAANIPPLDPSYGWWGVVRAGGKPDALLHWSKGRVDQPLLLPPGSYDMLWKQNYTHEPYGIKHAVTVRDNELVEVDMYPSKAFFLGADSTTQGNWQGVHGIEGFILVNYKGDGQDIVSRPTHLGSYAYSRNTGFRVWSSDTSDARALAPHSGNRVAAASSGSSFSLTLAATDTAPHTLALYFVDWDGRDDDGRAQQIVIYDATTNEVLDRRTLTDFHSGVYYLYEMQGGIRIDFTRAGGADAVLSGVFWGPLKPADESELLAAIQEIGDGRQKEAVLTVRRGEEILLFTMAGAEEDAATLKGLTGRYLTGSGYGRLLVERHDPALQFSWWQDGPDKFPDAPAPPPGEPLWAEWEGEVLVPRDETERIIALSRGQPLGIATQPSEAGVRIESVNSGSPGEVGGLRAGDSVMRVAGAATPQKKEVAFRLEVPGGGYLFVDGHRQLASITCVENADRECQTTSRQLEASRRLAAGKHPLRAAAVRRGSKEEAAAEGATPPPSGPRLSWRLPGAKDFEQVPSTALRASPPPGVWNRTPRQAAQVGLDWLQSTAVTWQRDHQCYGCHVQSQALMGMAIARDNDYRVSDPAYAALLNGIASFQKDGGAWDGTITGAQFGAMALAVVAHRGKEGRGDTLMRAVQFLLKAQQQDGRVHLDAHHPPIQEGDIQATANARIAFSLASQMAPPAEAGIIKQAEQRVLQWLTTAQTKTNQDRAMRVLGLAVEDPEERKRLRPQIEQAKADLLKHQLGDGGWAEDEGMGSNAYATGQALYALRVAGQSIASAPFQRGVKWLLQRQLWTGSWPPENTRSSHRSQYAPTMWPVIALVGSFGGMVVELTEPAEGTCIQGTVDLSARVVTEERVDLVRFLVDGREVGRAQQPSAEGVYRASWDAGTVPAGAHEVRAEAVQDGRTRGEDQTVIYTTPPGSRCMGRLSVAATQDLLASVLAPPQIELILDASGSMKRKLEGRPMIDIAKDVMAQIIQGLPDEIRVALRIYGHRIRERQRGDCQDSELVFPFAKIDKARLLDRVRAVRALGTTPIAYSLQQVGADFGGAPGEKMVILVTDGKEECKGNPSAVVSQLVQQGLKVRLNIVGFALADEATKQEMQRVAEIGGGHFFDAKNTKDLLQGIQQALVAPYEVLDGSGNKVSGGQVGEKAIALPVGTYTVVVHAAGEPITIADVQVVYNQLTRVELTKDGQGIGTRVVRSAR